MACILRYDLVCAAGTDVTFEYRSTSHVQNGKVSFYGVDCNSSRLVSIETTIVACAAYSDKTCHRIQSHYGTNWAIPEGGPMPCTLQASACPNPLHAYRGGGAFRQGRISRGTFRR